MTSLPHESDIKVIEKLRRMRLKGATKWDNQFANTFQKKLMTFTDFSSDIHRFYDHPSNFSKTSRNLPKKPPEVTEGALETQKTFAYLQRKASLPISETHQCLPSLPADHEDYLKKAQQALHVGRRHITQRYLKSVNKLSSYLDTVVTGDQRLDTMHECYRCIESRLGVVDGEDRDDKNGHEMKGTLHSREKSLQNNASKAKDVHVAAKADAQRKNLILDGTAELFHQVAEGKKQTNEVLAELRKKKKDVIKSMAMMVSNTKAEHPNQSQVNTHPSQPQMTSPRKNYVLARKLSPLRENEKVKNHRETMEQYLQLQALESETLHLIEIGNELERKTTHEFYSPGRKLVSPKINGSFVRTQESLVTRGLVSPTNRGIQPSPGILSTQNTEFTGELYAILEKIDNVLAGKTKSRINFPKEALSSPIKTSNGRSINAVEEMPESLNFTEEDRKKFDTERLNNANYRKRAKGSTLKAALSGS